LDSSIVEFNKRAVGFFESQEWSVPDLLVCTHVNQVKVRNVQVIYLDVYNSYLRYNLYLLGACLIKYKGLDRKFDPTLPKNCLENCTISSKSCPNRSIIGTSGAQKVRNRAQKECEGFRAFFYFLQVLIDQKS